MNKILLGLSFAMAIILAGCGGSSVEVSLAADPTPETDSTFEIFLTQDGEAVTDFSGETEWRMVDMDHGTEVAPLTHTDEGVYEGTVNLPMPGDWTIDIIGESDSAGSIDQTIEVEIR